MNRCSRQPAVTASTFGMQSIEANRTKPLANENFEDKNKRLQRPISPHLSVYKFQSNMALSITHRFTGLAQSGFLYGLALGNIPAIIVVSKLLWFLYVIIECFGYVRCYDITSIFSLLPRNAGSCTSSISCTCWQIPNCFPIFIPLG